MNKHAEIITIGTELLAGTARPNTNFSEIALALERAGIEVAFATTVGDHRGRLAAAIAAALGRMDVVILTGGLGATHDDLTREALAEATGRELEFDARIESAIREYFAQRGRSMSELNLRQALVPQGANVLPNPWGTAPGLRLEHEGVTIFALPGVPSEMRAMLEDHVVPWLAALGSGCVFVNRTLKTAGVGESDLAQRVGRVIDANASAGTPEITLLASAGEVQIRMRANGPSRDAGMDLIRPVERGFREALGSTVYGADEQTLASVVSDLLKAGGLTVAVAESFTGGAVTSRLVAEPGASLCLKAGFVTYAIEAKVSELGVSQELLDEYGAVSAEAAMAMAGQARLRSGADIGLSTTGEAGPEPQEEAVGTMFIGLSWEGGATAFEHRAGGSRQNIRLWGTNAALNILRLWLVKGPLLTVLSP